MGKLDVSFDPVKEVDFVNTYKAKGISQPITGTKDLRGRIVTAKEFEFMIKAEDGTELECDVIAIFPVNGRDYIALLPNKPVEGYEENEVFLYRYAELEGDDIDLGQIESDEEYEAVADAFDELLDEEEFNNIEE